MNKAKIYQPARNVMQSGKGNTRRWLLEFIPETPYFIDGLTGCNGMNDTTREISLRFPSKESAISYADKQNIEYEIFLPNEFTENNKAYADNFMFNKVRI